MASQNAEEMFLTLLGDVHSWEQHMAQLWEQLCQSVQDPEIRNVLSVRAYLTRQDASNIEKCFQILGKQSSLSTRRFYQTMAEDFRREFDAIQQPSLKAIYALWAIRTVQNAVIGEYSGLIMMAGIANNVAVTSLLEHNLADKVDFVDRSRELFRDLVQRTISARAATRAA